MERDIVILSRSGTEPLNTALSGPYLISETRLQHLIRTGEAATRFLQGVYPFVGRGVFDLGPLNDDLTYTVPPAKTVEILYVRAGNLSDDLIYLALTENGTPIRYFPAGPKADFHVALAIVEAYPEGTRLDVCLAAPRGLTGAVVIDIGMVEVNTGK